MSNPFTTQQIQERFQSLPADMQTAIASAETAARIEEIGRKRGLRIDAIGVLIEYSGLIMLGLIKSNDFIDHLTEQLSISREQAESLAVDVDSQVFSRIRSSLRDVQYQSTTDNRFEEEETTVSLSTTPEETVESTEHTEEIVDKLVSSAASTADYDPNQFTQVTTPHPSDEITSDIQATPESNLDQHQETGFETNPIVSDINEPIVMSDEPQENSFQENENAAYNAAAQSVINDMPGAIKDAYSAREAQAPKAPVQPTAIKDFKTRLEEKMASTETNSVNADPYKESI